jgi:hypothetical protein
MMPGKINPLIERRGSKIALDLATAGASSQSALRTGEPLSAVGLTSVAE